MQDAGAMKFFSIFLFSLVSPFFFFFQ